jgi:transposase
VSIPEAARRLGLSIVTVRRRIKQGTLEAELQPGRRGPEYRVRLPSETPLSSPAPEQDAAQEQPLARVMTMLIQRQTGLLERIRELEEARLAEGKAAAEWRTRAGQSALRAEQLERRLAEVQAELDRARRPWWRFWG